MIRYTNLHNMRVQNKYNNGIVYFRFFASKKYPNCFWYTPTLDAENFEIGRIDDYEPLEKSWEEVMNEEK